MRHYEIVVMASSELGDRSDVADRYKTMVDGGGGKVHRFEDWGVRPLAYPVNRKTHARYFLYNIECDQQTLDSLKESFRFSETIMRSLVIRRERAIVDESPILKEMRERKDEGDESGSFYEDNSASLRTPGTDISEDNLSD